MCDMRIRCSRKKCRLLRCSRRNARLVIAECRYSSVSGFNNWIMLAESTGCRKAGTSRMVRQGKRESLPKKRYSALAQTKASRISKKT